MFRNAAACSHTIQRRGLRYVRYTWKYKWQRPGTRERQIMEQMSVPVLHPRLKESSKLHSETCQVALDAADPYYFNKEQNPYLDFVVRKSRESLFRSHFFAIIDRGAIKVNDFIPIKVRLLDEGFTVFNVHNYVIREALKDTKLRNLDPLWNTVFPTTFICSDSETPKVKELLKIIKDPHIVLLGSVMQDRILSAVATRALADLPSLHDCQAQVCSTLQTSLSRTVRHLGHPGRYLSTLLHSHSKQQPDSESDSR